MVRWRPGEQIHSVCSGHVLNAEICTDRNVADVQNWFQTAQSGKFADLACAFSDLDGADCCALV
jgi:hypothetical protein